MRKDIYHYENHEDAGASTTVTVPKWLRPIPYLSIIGVLVCFFKLFTAGDPDRYFFIAFGALFGAFVINIIVFLISAKLSPKEAKDNLITYHEKVTVVETPNSYFEEVIDLSDTPSEEVTSNE